MVVLFQKVETKIECDSQRKYTFHSVLRSRVKVQTPVESALTDVNESEWSTESNRT